MSCPYSFSRLPAAYMKILVLFYGSDDRETTVPVIQDGYILLLLQGKVCDLFFRKSFGRLFRTVASIHGFL